MIYVTSVDTVKTLVEDVIGQLIHDVIGRLSVEPMLDVIGQSVNIISNSPSQDYTRPDDCTSLNYVGGFTVVVY